ncbi:MAG: capsular polysaccharide export protein, LipB/KpsS family [Shimia sp.]
MDLLPLTILSAWDASKDGLYAALTEVAGHAERRTVIGLSRKDYPETAEVVAHCMSRAKRQHGGAMAGAKRTLIARQYNWSRRHFEVDPRRIAVVWNGTGGSRRAFALGARDAGAGTLFCELAPFAGYVTADPAGVNAESSVPRTRAAVDGWRLSDARRSELDQGLVARAARTKNVAQEDRALPDAPFLFVPLQVPKDSQVTVFGGWCRSMEAMLSALERAAGHLPEGWHLRVKEHPSATSSLADVIEAAGGRTGGRIVLDNQTDTFAQMRASRGVVTLNSSLALQAFLMRKPVTVLGEAFFAQDGLVRVASDDAALAAALGEAGGQGFDDAWRMALMGYLFDAYWLPYTPEAGVDRDRAATRLAEAGRTALARK